MALVYFFAVRVFSKRNLLLGGEGASATNQKYRVSELKQSLPADPQFVLSAQCAYFRDVRTYARRAIMQAAHAPLRLRVVALGADDRRPCVNADARGAERRALVASDLSKAL